MIIQTGNKTVDEMAKINLSGNVIPQTWYRVLIRDNGKPYLAAIVILADIAYWYRPIEVRDEGTGAVMAYKKRFKEDLLQRSYAQMADLFGISKQEATNAIIYLEKVGVIKRVFRTTEVNGTKMSNVLYIGLNTERLKEITFPQEYEEEIIPQTATAAEPEKPAAKKAEKDPPKTRYAEFVELTEEEHGKLVAEYGEEATARMIKKLDNYKGSSGKKYKSDYRAILTWVAGSVMEDIHKQGGTPSGKSVGDFTASNGFRN